MDGVAQVSVPGEHIAEVEWQGKGHGKNNSTKVLAGTPGLGQVAGTAQQEGVFGRDRRRHEVGVLADAGDFAVLGWRHGCLKLLAAVSPLRAYCQGECLNVQEARTVGSAGDGCLGASPAATRLRRSATRRAANSLCRWRRTRCRTPSLRDSHPWRGVGLGGWGGAIGTFSANSGVLNLAVGVGVSSRAWAVVREDLGAQILVAVRRGPIAGELKPSAA